jgi:hypothetical protein
MGSVAGPELGLGFLHMAANRLFAKAECFGNLTELRSGRNQPQDRQFPSRQVCVRPDMVRITIDKLLEAQCSKASGGVNYDPYRLRYGAGKLFGRPESHHPPTSNRTSQSIAQPVLEGQLVRPLVNSDWLK